MDFIPQIRDHSISILGTLKTISEKLQTNQNIIQENTDLQNELSPFKRTVDDIMSKMLEIELDCVDLENGYGNIRDVVMMIDGMVRDGEFQSLSSLFVNFQRDVATNVKIVLNCTTAAVEVIGEGEVVMGRTDEFLTQEFLDILFEKMRNIIAALDTLKDLVEMNYGTKDDWIDVFIKLRDSESYIDSINDIAGEKCKRLSEYIACLPSLSRAAINQEAKKEDFKQLISDIENIFPEIMDILIEKNPELKIIPSDYKKKSNSLSVEPLNFRGIEKVKPKMKKRHTEGGNVRSRKAIKKRSSINRNSTSTLRIKDERSAREFFSENIIEFCVNYFEITDTWDNKSPQDQAILISYITNQFSQYDTKLSTIRRKSDSGRKITPEGMIISGSAPSHKRLSSTKKGSRLSKTIKPTKSINISEFFGTQEIYESLDHTLSKKDGLYSDKKGIMKKLVTFSNETTLFKSLGMGLGEEISEFLTSIYDYVCYVCNNFSFKMRDALTLVEHGNFVSDMLSKYRKKLKIFLKEVEYENSDAIGFRILNDAVDNFPKNGEVLDIDVDSKSNESWLRYIQTNCLEDLLGQYQKLYYLAIQFMTGVKLFENGDDVVILFGNISAQLDLFHQILNDIETMNYLYTIVNTESNRSVKGKKEMKASMSYLLKCEEEDDLSNLWAPGEIGHIIIRVTSDYPDDEVWTVFRSVLLSTFPDYTTPKEIIQLLIARYLNLKKSKHSKHEKMLIKSYVLDIFDKFLELYYYYIDEELAGILLKFCDDNLIKDGFTREAAQMRMCAQEQFYLRIESLQTISTELMNLGSIPFLSISDFNPLIVAQVLCQIDYELYIKIRPSELLKQSWNDPELKFHTLNVVQLLQRTNQISFWVATCIMRHKSPKNRAKAITSFINIANELKYLKNYNSLMGIIAGLNTGAIDRLSQSFAKVSKSSMSEFQTLQTLMHPTNSFKALRTAIESNTGVTIPYLGVFLTDLTYIDENKTFLENKTINLEKQKLVYTAINNLLKYKDEVFTFETDKEDLNMIYPHLYRLPNLPETELYNLSYAYEPRG